MDSRKLDALARSRAAPRSPRRLLGAVAALGAGLAGRRAGAQDSQVYCGNMVCASDPGKCKAGCVCCVYLYGNSRCRPPQECTVPGTIASQTTTTTTAAPTTTTTPTTTTVAPTTTEAPTTSTTTTPPITCGNMICAPGQDACLSNGSYAKTCTSSANCPTSCG